MIDPQRIGINSLIRRAHHLGQTWRTGYKPDVTCLNNTLINSTAPLSPVGPSLKPRLGAYALLDAVRGIACLWVVGHHSLGFLAENNPQIAANPIYRVGLNGALGVWVFFVVSGYCIANTAVAGVANSRRHWVQARIRRIFPSCWFASLVCIASALLAQYLVNRGILKSSHLADSDILHQHPLFYIANLTLTQRLFHEPLISGVYWTLCYEVGFYAVVGVALYLNRRWGSASLLLKCLHSITVLSLTANVLFPRYHVYPFDLWPHFGFGVMLFDIIHYGWNSFVKIAVVLTIASGAVFWSEHHHRMDYVDIGGGVSLVTSALTASILLCLYRFDEYLANLAALRAMAWVGVFSYSLYLTHVTIIGYLYKGCQIIGLLPNLLPVYFALALLISVGFARIFFHFCERPFLSGRRVREVASVIKEEMAVP